MNESKCRNEKVDMLRGFAIIFVLLGHGLDLVMKNGIASSSVIQLLWMGDSLTWFLLSMLLVKTVFNILDTYASDVVTLSVFSLLFWLSCIFPQYKLFYYLQWGVFFCVGYVIHKYFDDNKWRNIVYIVCVNMFLIGVDRYILSGLDKFVKIFVGVSIFILYMCIKNIPHSIFLALCGRNSMVIYMMHGLSQFVCYYVIVEVLHIKEPIIVLCLIIILQLLLAFTMIGLFTKVKCLQWMQIIFYPYKYLSEKKEGEKKKMFR